MMKKSIIIIGILLIIFLIGICFATDYHWSIGVYQKDKAGTDYSVNIGPYQLDEQEAAPPAAVKKGQIILIQQ